ncbi:MAG: hypothetical protein ACYDHP_02945 [Ferrimicrobium sp.]
MTRPQSSATQAHGTTTRARWQELATDRRRNQALMFITASAILLSSCGQSTHHSTHTAPPKNIPTTSIPSGSGDLITQIHWWIAISSLHAIASVAGNHFIERYFDSPATTVIVHQHIPSFYSTWRSSFAIDATSLASVQDATAMNSTARFVLYDAEHWNYTPTSEQLNLSSAVSSAVRIVHAAHRSLLTAPAVDLAKVLKPGLPIAQGFLESGALAASARNVAGVDIQAQSLEDDPSRYLAFVSAAAAAIKAVNPQAAIYAGLSTNPSGHHVSSKTLLEDVHATLPLVTGFWLNVPGGGAKCPRCGVPQPQVAISLLQAL